MGANQKGDRQPTIYTVLGVRVCVRHATRQLQVTSGVKADSSGWICFVSWRLMRLAYAGCMVDDPSFGHQPFMF